MRKLKIILTVIPLFSILPLTACLSGDKYYTYKLATFPSETYNSGHGDIKRYYHEQKLKIDNTNKDIGYNKDFTFYMDEGGEWENGTIYDKGLYSMQRYIYTGPYKLSVRFDSLVSSIGGAKKVIFNKILFQSKDKVIDLREKVAVKITSFGKQLDGKDLSNFRKTGVIDILKIEEEFRRSRSPSIPITGILLIYDDVDVAFKHDGEFTIEYDIDFEVYNGKITKYAFIVPFKRVTIDEKLTLGERIGGIVKQIDAFCYYSGCCSF